MWALCSGCRSVAGRVFGGIMSEENRRALRAERSVAELKAIDEELWDACKCYPVDEAAVEQALQEGADPNYMAWGVNGGQVALGPAALNGSVRAVELLLEAGADVHAPGFRGKSALFWAKTSKRDGAQEVAQLLRDHGATDELLPL
jgi:ankyrin repeat protein